MTKPSLFLKALPLLAIPLAGCGFENPYEDGEEGCKFQCSKNKGGDSNKTGKGERDHPRTTPTIPTDSTYWVNVITTNNIAGKLGSSSKAAEEFFNLISTSPLALSQGPTSITGLLGKIRTDFDSMASLANNGGALKEKESCLLEKFKTPLVADGATSSVIIDYGKCLPLNDLTQQTDSGAIAFTEFEAALQVSTNLGAGTLINGLDLPKVFPFNTALQSLTLGGVSEAEFYLGKAIQQTSVDIVNKKVKDAFRDWAFFSLGANPDKPFRVAFDSIQHRLTLNGDMFSLSATTVNPTSADSFSGEASQGDYIQIRFKDFAMTSETDGGTFAFNRDAILTGSYLVLVNGTLFELVGQNKKCELTATMRQVNQDPQPIGTVTVCH
jgi:hypothetical protein